MVPEGIQTSPPVVLILSQLNTVHMFSTIQDPFQYYFPVIWLAWAVFDVQLLFVLVLLVCYVVTLL
jgi:hypothetical protein